MNEKRTNLATPGRPTVGASHHLCVSTATVAFARARGLTIPEIEHVSGVPYSAFANPDARLPDDIPNKIWRALMDRSTPTVALCIEAARGAPFSALGGLAHGTQYASTLRDALVFIAKNSAFLADRIDVAFTETDGEGVLSARHPNDFLDEGRVSETGAALIVRLVREVLGVKNAPARMEFAYAPYGLIEQYQEFYRCATAFNRGHTALVFTKPMLNEPIRTADPSLFEFIEAHFELSLSQIQGRSTHPTLARIEKAIAECAACGDYRVSSVVARADLSYRSAQREVARHGTSLKELIDNHKRATAEALLRSRTDSIEAIGSLIGFSDERAFRRAFERWTGTTPSRYRRSSGSLSA